MLEKIVKLLNDVYYSLFYFEVLLYFSGYEWELLCVCDNYWIILKDSSWWCLYVNYKSHQYSSRHLKTAFNSWTHSTKWSRWSGIPVTNNQIFCMNFCLVWGLFFKDSGRVFSVISELFYIKCSWAEAWLYWKQLNKILQHFWRTQNSTRVPQKHRILWCCGPTRLRRQVSPENDVDFQGAFWYIWPETTRLVRKLVIYSVYLFIH